MTEVRDRPYPAVVFLGIGMVGASMLPPAISTLSLYLQRGGSVTDAQVVTVMGAFGLGLISVMLVAGNVSDRVGRKRTAFVGIVLSLVGAVTAGISGSVAALTVGAGAGGIGMGVMSVVSSAAVADLFPSRRMRAYAILYAIMALGAALGPMAVGAVAASSLGRLGLAVGAPFSLLGGLGLYWSMANRRSTDHRAWDAGGILLAVVASSTLFVGINMVSRTPGPAAVGFVAAGLILFVGLVVWERSRPEPILDVKLFRNRSFAVAAVVAALASVGIEGVALVLSQYAQFVVDLTPTAAAIVLAPAAAVAVVAMMTSPMLSRALGPRTLVAGALIVGAVICAGSTVVLDGTPRASVLVAFLIVTFSISVVIAPLQAVIADNVPAGRVGQGFGTTKVLRQFAMLIGMTIVLGAFSTGFTGALHPALRAQDLDANQEIKMGTVGQALEMREQMVSELGPDRARLLLDAQHLAFSAGQQRGLLVGAGSLALGALVAVVGLPGRKPRAPEA